MVTTAPARAVMARQTVTLLTMHAVFVEETAAAVKMLVALQMGTAAAVKMNVALQMGTAAAVKMNVAFQMGTAAAVKMNVAFQTVMIQRAKDATASRTVTLLSMHAVFVEETRAAVQAVTEWQIVANTLMRVATAAAKATTAEDAPGHLTQPLSVQVMDVAAMMMSIRSLITTLTRQLAAHLAATVLLWGSCGSRM